MKEKEEEYEAKESELKDTVEALEEQLEEVKTNLSTVVIELDEPESKKRKMADAQAMEIESYPSSIRTFSSDSMRIPSHSPSVRIFSTGAMGIPCNPSRRFQFAEPRYSSSWKT